MESSTPEGITVTVKQEPEEPHNQHDGEGRWSVATSQVLPSPLDQGVVIKTERTGAESGKDIGSRDSQGSSVAVHYPPALNPVMTYPLGHTPYKPLSEQLPGGSRTVFQDSQAAVHDMELPEDLSTREGLERPTFQRPQIISTEGRRIHIPLQGGNQTMFHESRFAIQYHEDLSNKEGKQTSALERRYFQGRQIFDTDHRTIDGMGTSHIPYGDTRSHFSEKVQKNHRADSDGKADGGGMTMVHESGIAIHCQEDILNQESLKEMKAFEGTSSQRPEIPLATTETSLDEEVQPVQNDQPSQCTICLKNFLHLKSHMKVHTAARPFKCRVCDKAFIENRHLENHMRSHTGERPFQCPFCQKAFGRDTHLTYHLRTHTGIKPFTCKTCGKSFKRKGDLTVHNRIHTGERPFAYSSDGKDYGDGMTMVHESGIAIHCQEDIPTQDGKEITVSEETSRQRPEIPLATTETSLDEEVQPVQDDQLSQCKICLKNFLHLKSHMKVHTAERPFKCSVCDKAYIESRHLENHMRSHTGEKPFQCPVCQKAFSRDTHLTYHLRTHTGIKPFTCETCGKSFSRKGDLTVHNRIHTGERPFACKLCDKACSTQSNLKLHMRGHTGEKPYSCTACPKTFKSKSDLIKHVRTHTGERPYRCVECHRDFRASSDLTRHMRSHTNEKPYKCDVCLKEFSSDGYLPKHVCVPKTTNSISPCPTPVNNGEAVPLQTSLGCDDEINMEAENTVIQNTVYAPLVSAATCERDASKID